MSVVTDLMTIPCSIVRRSNTGDVDDYGTPEQTESFVETVCEIQQVTSDEPPASGEVARTMWKAWFPPGLDIRTGDALITGNRTYEIVGDPAEWRDPDTQQDWYIEVEVARTMDEDLS